MFSIGPAARSASPRLSGPLRANRDQDWIGQDGTDQVGTAGDPRDRRRRRRTRRTMRDLLATAGAPVAARGLLIFPSPGRVSPSRRRRLSHPETGGTRDRSALLRRPTRPSSCSARGRRNRARHRLQSRLLPPKSVEAVVGCGGGRSEVRDEPGVGAALRDVVFCQRQHPHVGLVAAWPACHEFLPVDRLMDDPVCVACLGLEAKHADHRRSRRVRNCRGC